MRRPSKAPLRKITKRHPPDRYGEVRLVDVICGHSVMINKNQHPERTRCYTCLHEQQKAWDDDHTCRHGVVIIEDVKVCKDCYIIELEKKVLDLKRKLHEC